MQGTGKKNKPLKKMKQHYSTMMCEDSFIGLCAFMVLKFFLTEHTKNQCQCIMHSNILSWGKLGMRHFTYY
jgi:hypothetical protein